MIRFGSQACGLAFAHTPSLINLLIAYVVLSTPGFLVLIFASFHATLHEQRLKFGVSWFDTREIIKGARFKFLNSPFALTRLILIAGSIIAIVGGLVISNARADDSNYSSEVQLSRSLRVAGSTMLLVGNLILILLAIFALTKETIRTVPMKLIVLCAPFLLVRCVYNFLAIYVTEMNYFNFENYLGSENKTLILSENIMSTAMECVIWLLLAFSFLTTVHHKISYSKKSNEETSSGEP